ncbi:ECF transporter S component [Paucilactobacillus wasatchensis]|uniref:Substrate-specific component PdxU2 of predicted pyridoxin-related ECF transporter n=1 Tax=Paucilactobacillus wasatchensis TaxID=1335616 RepID=A0A0D1AAX0_9LACO|nr:ECF transporter S component [Paucilactobacillus wasatchensis]KIS03871.1 Substrate-specific component PdxU2 of predicted pyridoxin-related ECF transporter [Paucilactobacillus wasatchensis]
MQTNRSVRQLIIPAMFVAATVVISRFFIIPVPMTHGNVNLCDAGIFMAALLFGRRDGLIVGGLSGFLLDLISGYSQYMLFSLVVHGLEGLIAGWLGYQATRKMQFFALFIGIIVMVGGYFISDTILYSLTPGLLGVPMNLLQGLVGAVIAWPLSIRLRKYINR